MTKLFLTDIVCDDALTAQSVQAGADDASGPAVNINGAAGAMRALQYQTASSLRWTVYCTTDGEAGGSVGSNFEIGAYDDGGSRLSTPLSIDRPTGVVTFSNGVAIQGSSTIDNATIDNATIGISTPGAAVFTSVNTTTLTASASFQLGSDTSSGPVAATFNAAAGSLRYLLFQTASSDRWRVGCDDSGESGSNAGANLFINAYDDGGSYLSQPLLIDRTTGVTIGTHLAVLGTLSGQGVTDWAASPPAIGVTTPNAGIFSSFRVGSDTAAGPLAAIIDGAAASARYVSLQTASTDRWRIGCDDSAEGGGNAGCSFFINAYDDSGFFLSQPLAIDRATGVVSFASAFSVPTASVGENSGVVASTAFVIGQAGTSDPLADGTAAAGASTRYSREDHVHPFAGSLQIGGGSGPTWTSGTGAPSGTQTRGSLYSRTDGGVGTTLYVSRGGGTWNAVSGV